MRRGEQTEGRRGSGQETGTGKREKAEREVDELNKRLNNTHQGLINCCSMGATS